MNVQWIMYYQCIVAAAIAAPSAKPWSYPASHTGLVRSPAVGGPPQPPCSATFGAAGFGGGAAGAAFFGFAAGAFAFATFFGGEAFFGAAGIAKRGSCPKRVRLVYNN